MEAQEWGVDVSYPGRTPFGICEASGLWVKEDGRVKRGLTRLSLLKRKDGNSGSVVSADV